MTTRIKEKDMRKCCAVLMVCLLALGGCGGGDDGAGGNPLSPGSSSSSSVPSVGKFLYIPNTGADSIAAYAINASSGALTAIPGAPFTTGTGLKSLVPDPSGKYLYTANEGGSLASASISGFAINAATGTLSSTPGSPYAAGTTSIIEGPIFQPAGNFLYVRKIPEFKIYGYSLNSGDGVLTPLTVTPFPTSDGSGRMNTTNGRFYMPDNSGSGNAISVYEINGTTGVGTLRGSALTGQTSSGVLEFDPANRFLYSVSPIDKTIAGFSIDATTGLLTAVGGANTVLSGAVFPASSTVHVSGKFLYVLDTNSFSPTPTVNSSIHIFAIDSLTGVLSAVGSPVSTGGFNAAGMRIYSDGNYLVVINRGSASMAIFGINQTTGALTPVVGSPFATPGPAPSIVTIEPSGKFAYLPDTANATVTQFTINASMGTFTRGDTYPTGAGPVRALVVGLQ